MKTVLLIPVTFFLLVTSLQAQEHYFIGFQPESTTANPDKRNINSIETLLKHYINQPFKVENAYAEEKINALQLRAKTEEAKEAVLRLKQTIRLTATLTKEEIAALKTDAAIRFVEHFQTTPLPPPSDIPPATPVLDSSQTFLKDNPGLNVLAAWKRNIKGKGITLSDVEYGFNGKHEDLIGLPVSIVSDYPLDPSLTYAYTEHGTAALGISIAGKNGYGVSGMAHELDKAQLFPEWTTNGYNREAGIMNAIDHTSAGNVLLLEMQAYGSTNYCPAEFVNTVWDLSKAAVELGIIVVAAAGNGNQDLDSPDYTEYMGRGSSGVIMVGAGAKTTAHTKMGFSTYGKRVDIQGWGEGVLSPGYGNYAKYGNDTNQYYGLFSGTSSGSALIAGACVLLQSHFHQETGEYLNIDQMRTALQTGAHKQVDSAVAGNVGRLPNLAKALERVDAFIAEWNGSVGVKKVDFNEVKLYPNPSVGELNIVCYNSEQLREIRIYTTDGKLLKTAIGATQLNYSDLPMGLYRVAVEQENKTTYLNWVKH